MEKWRTILPGCMGEGPPLGEKSEWSVALPGVFVVPRLFISPLSQCTNKFAGLDTMPQGRFANRPCLRVPSMFDSLEVKVLFTT
jgi:hypothetical protein